MNIEVSIIVPVYNEEVLIVENLQTIAEVMSKSGLQYEIIAIDDGSTDRSHELMRHEYESADTIRIVRHKNNQGYSETIRTGLRSAQGTYVTYLDADLQFSPHDVPRFYQHAKNLSVPIVWGQSDKTSYSALRLLVSRSHNILYQLLFNVPATIDLNSLKLIKRSVLQNFTFSTRKETINLELLLHAVRNNHQIAPLPIKVAQRTQGKSSFHIGLIFQSLRNAVSLLLNKFRV